MFFITVVINLILYGTSIYYFVEKNYLVGGILLGVAILTTIFLFLRYSNKKGISDGPLDCALLPLDCIDCDSGGLECGGIDCN